MRRSLVLTNETARHPFRASLPPHVTAISRDGHVEKKVPWRLRMGLDATDMRGFLNSYCACLVGVGTFIA